MRPLRYTLHYSAHLILTHFSTKFEAAPPFLGKNFSFSQSEYQYVNYLRELDSEPMIYLKIGAFASVQDRSTDTLN